MCALQGSAAPVAVTWSKGLKQHSDRVAGKRAWPKASCIRCVHRHPSALARALIFLGLGARLCHLEQLPVHAFNSQVVHADTWLKLQPRACLSVGPVQRSAARDALQQRRALLPASEGSSAPQLLHMRPIGFHM